MFQINAPVIFRAKLEEVQTNVAIYSHALLRIHPLAVKGRWELLLPPCLLITAVQQPGTLWRRLCISRWHSQRSASTEMED